MQKLCVLVVGICVYRVCVQVCVCVSIKVCVCVSSVSLLSVNFHSARQDLRWNGVSVRQIPLVSRELLLCIWAPETQKLHTTSSLKHCVNDSNHPSPHNYYTSKPADQRKKHIDQNPLQSNAVHSAKTIPDWFRVSTFLPTTTQSKFQTILLI